MSPITRILAAASVIGAIGLAACEEDNIVDIDTPEGGIEIEEDGDINID